MTTDAHGTTFEPWTDGHAVGFKITSRSGRVEYVYLNPSTDSDDGVSTAFVYQGPHGDPGLDGAACYLDVVRPPSPSETEHVRASMA